MHLPCIVDAVRNSKVVSWWNKGKEFAAVMLCLSSPKLCLRGIPLLWWYSSDFVYCKGELNKNYFCVFSIVGFIQNFSTLAIYFSLTKFSTLFGVDSCIVIYMMAILCYWPLSSCGPQSQIQMDLDKSFWILTFKVSALLNWLAKEERKSFDHRAVPKRAPKVNVLCESMPCSSSLQWQWL